MGGPNCNFLSRPRLLARDLGLVCGSRELPVPLPRPFCCETFLSGQRECSCGFSSVLLLTAPGVRRVVGPSSEEKQSKPGRYAPLDRANPGQKKGFAFLLEAHSVSLWEQNSLNLFLRRQRNLEYFKVTRNPLKLVVESVAFKCPLRKCSVDLQLIVTPYKKVYWQYPLSRQSVSLLLVFLVVGH